MRSSFALLGLLGLAFAAHSAAGNDDFHTYGPIAVHSDGDGELSTGIYTINATTTGTLMVNYAAPRTHCSSLRMHFLLDGHEKIISGDIAPGQRTGFVDLGPVSPGTHVVGLQAEGIPGGCNTGKTLAWEGDAEVWTTLPPSDKAYQPDKELGDVFFDVSFVKRAGGVSSHGTLVTADGFIFSYRAAPDGSASNKPNANGRYSEASVREHFSRGRILIGHVRTDGFEQIKRLALKLGNDPERENVPRPMATDQGETTYRVFRRRGSTDEYEVLLIGESGDRQWTNGTVEGVALKGWLTETLKASGHESAPHDIVCVTLPCPDSAGRAR
jgi:hypothetical protein